MGALLQPFVTFGIVGAVLAGLWFAVDQIGNVREREVRAEFDRAALEKNVDIAGYNSAAEALDAVIAAKVSEALAAAGKVPPAPGSSGATAEQAAALNAIRRAGR